MERCDFSSVCRTILDNASLNQVEFLEMLFDDYARVNLFFFNAGLSNRWLRGLKPLSSAIIKYYGADDKADNLMRNLSKSIMPQINDYNNLTKALHDLVLNDVSISDDSKKELLSYYPCDSKSEAVEFICNILIFAMSRPFVTRDTKIIEKHTSSGALSPIVSERIFGADIPAPCKHFSGRDKELAELHEILSENNKVFVNGVGGIGKSEFVKAFAREFKKDFTNILYFYYDTDLKNLIADIDFSDDRLEDNDDEKFKRHNRYLRSLKEDTLIVIDNFDTTASDEGLLDVVMKYKCKVIFTTRSNFDCGYTYSLNEISDIDGLFELFGKLYSEADKNRDTVINIIESVNRHTLSVELAARLLEKGLLAPDEVLQKLTECSVDPETSDRINIHKDGKGVKATFYEHIRTLFSLFKLSEDYQFILRCLTFVPVEGVYSKLFANWLALPDMNGINDLIELGFIKENAPFISLHQIVREIAVADLKPSVTNCADCLKELQDICLCHGVDDPNYTELFTFILNIIEDIKNDDTDSYIRFIVNAFPYMEKYQHESGMRRILSVMKAYKAQLKPNDLALYYDFESAVAGMFDKDFKKAISLSQTALNTCVPADDLHLAANLNMNLGYNYHLAGQLEPAREYMECAIKLMSEYGKPNNDMLIIYHNYANLMDDCGEPMKAIRAMKKCAEFIKDVNGESADYADFRLSMGKMYLKIGNVQNAKENFSVAFNIYASLFGADSELFESKLTELVDFAESHGIPFNRNLITA